MSAQVHVGRDSIILCFGTEVCFLSDYSSDKSTLEFLYFFPPNMKHFFKGQQLKKETVVAISGIVSHLWWGTSHGYSGLNDQMFLSLKQGL